MQIKSSDKIAIIDGNKKISYNQLVEKIYHWIKVAKIVNGSNIALVANPSLDWISVLLATLKRKAMINLIDPNLKASKLALLINNSSASTLIISSEYFEKVKNYLKSSSSRNILFIDKNIFAPILLPETATYKPEGFAPAVCVATKGRNSLFLSKSNIMSNIDNIKKRNLINENDKVSIDVSYCHAFGLIYAMGTLMLNATLILNSIEDKKNFATLIASDPLFFDKINSKVFNFNSLQSIAFRLLKIIKIPILHKLIFKKFYDMIYNMIGSNVRYMISFGSQLNRKVEANFKALGFNLISGYGLTEASALVSASLNSPIGSVGKPFDNTMIKILDNEILIKGPSVMVKYANLAKTNNPIINGWLHTGDLGYIKESYLYINGRKRNSLISSN